MKMITSKLDQRFFALHHKTGTKLNKQNGKGFPYDFRAPPSRPTSSRCRMVKHKTTTLLELTIHAHTAITASHRHHQVPADGGRLYRGCSVSNELSYAQHASSPVLCASLEEEQEIENNQKQHTHTECNCKARIR